MGNATTKSHHHPKSLTIGGANARRPQSDGPGLPAPPGKPILIPGADEFQPEVVGIRWERSASNGGSAIVGYLVEHRRLGSTHWVRSAPGLCTFPELSLSGLEPGWRYQFRVRAQNAVGLSRASEISDPLTVTLQRAATSPPQFDLELKDTVVLENEQAEFVVRFTGAPLPKISWFKDGFEIFSSRRTRIATDNGRSVLLIHQTALNDEGEIKCTATNRAGHVSTRARLSLEAPPKIRLPRQYEDGLLFEQDETIRLKVSLAGRPSPTVTWFHDGELVTRDERHVFEVMDGESVLKIPDAKRNDRGEYTVKATNSLGEDSSSFLVTVTDRPAAPGKATVTMTLGRSVTLSWNEPEDDGGCKIGTYIVEYYRIGWDVWLKATTSRQTTATLTELIEGSEYKFRVKAENPYGVSEPSEESDVIFIPDLKRGIVTPALSGKSQSHREISRSRGEKREVSFAVPTQRTRSLTREESRNRYEEDNIGFGPAERSVSAQRLPGSGRPSRADSRVTFALDIPDKPEEKPVPPTRSKDHSARPKNRTDNHVERPTQVDVTYEQNMARNKERAISPTVTISPPPMEEPQPTYREARSRSLSVPRERSMSPSSMPRIQEYREEDPPVNPSRLSRAPMNLTFKKQQALADESGSLSPRQLSIEEKPGSPTTPREDDENALRGSSEFMLVLYPEDREQNTKSEDMNGQDRRKTLETRQSTVEETEDEEDLIPPPMSLSLPELFSAEHQVVETLREAVSSTELLHERAMERFYRAVAAEEASEVSRRKSQLERVTGELATSKFEDDKRKSMDEPEPDLDTRRASIQRKSSGSGATSPSLLGSWQVKKNRRRSSEGQANISYKTSLKLLSPTLLPDVEARSDPNLPSELDTKAEEPWRKEGTEDSAKQLRRWHETNVPLIETKQKTEFTTPESIKTEEPPKSKDIPAEEERPAEPETQEEIDEELESVETSEESSEEISSADSEDLKLLKARILARQVLDEEDTYHPRGKPTPHVEPEPPPVPPHRIPIVDVSPPTPTRATTPVSPTTVVPKSILKKPKEEPIPVNSFGRPIPPEKPIRKIPPQPVQPVQRETEPEPVDRPVMSLPEPSRSPVMSESDTDSVLSAGEAAKNRRIQAKMRSMTPDVENEAEEMELRMAVVNHYTEIVREHSSHAGYRSSEERRFGDSLASSRRSSFSEDKDQRNHVTKDRTEAIVAPKPNGRQETSETKAKNRETERLERQTVQQAGSRRGSVGSRGTTPAREVKTGVEKRASRAPSRNESPAPRSRNVSGERGASSRSSSRTRARAPSQDRYRPPSRTGSEEQRFSRERSVEEGPRRAKSSSRPSSRTSSRSSSRDRHRATTPVESRMEKLQKALESKKYRSLRRGSTTEKSPPESANRMTGQRLAIEAKKKVRSTVDYVTDLTLLMAAIYVYLFKKEIMAIPFIALLLYRRVQEEINGRVSRGWWLFKRKQ